MKVVAYCRVSTNSEDQLNSLENQKNHYTKLFEKENLDVADCGMLYKKSGEKSFLYGIYADEGLSGAKDYEKREAFKKMIEDAKKGYFNKIYVKNVQRFTRYIKDGSSVLKELKKYDVEVFFEDGSLSSLNPSHELFINMFTITAQEESRIKGAAVQFGIRESQKKGKWTGGVHPFGYDLVKGYLHINNEESEIVKVIYDMYLNKGSGYQSIARYLNDDLKVTTKLGKQWSTKQIGSMLKNPLYKGVQRTHMTYVDDINSGTVKKVPEDKWIVHYKEELKIIDSEVWELTQRELAKRKKMHKDKVRPSNKHLLSNLLVCPKCGVGLRRKKRKAYVRKDGTSRDLGYEWRCTMNDRYGKSRCENNNMVIEKEIIENVKNKVIELKENKQKIDEKIMDVIKAKFNPNVDEEIKKILVEKEDINKQEMTNLNLLTKGIIDEKQFQKQNDELQKQLKENEYKHNKLLRLDEEVKELKFNYKQYINLLDSVDVNNLDNATLKKLIISVYVFASNKKAIETKFNLNLADEIPFYII
ncbi:DNA invertase Pin-like site-specific DNA recombinase [Natranaerovirga pectinivora]|uniref:DNA invertase Pin-like site-specific DNA recombinase n=1 Tax=Natranaerovirga pectinivora TaxID=682400 RepID=A0A4R3MN37_9FIRM|nr:recombinase family protein [Natranaerovirga pectinivora]TCT16409.1 DNA invertase Pin-like site-specific DNA recombinase [Natranaerovirga pectinivora]